MTAANLDHALQEGIAAIRKGERERGRDLLLQVVESDEHNEQGWYWLSLAVDDPADKIIALENVLQLNPANDIARASLRKLTGAPAQPVAPLPPNVDEEAIVPLESVGALDDPFQCIYCGAVAGQSDSHCPECKRSLLTQRAIDRARELSLTMRLTVIIMLLQFNLSVIGAQVLRAGDNFFFSGLRLNDYVGHPPQAWLPVVQGAMAVRAAALFVLILLIVRKITFAYYATAAWMIADVIWTGVRLGFGVVGPVSAAVDIATDLAACYFLFASDRSFAVNAERLLCVIDRSAKGGIALNHRGHFYKREGKWALAVAHWRAAIAAMPHQAEFYKDLAIGYAQIGYYRHALKSLDEFARRSPESPEAAPLKSLIEQKRAADPKPRD